VSNVRGNVRSWPQEGQKFFSLGKRILAASERLYIPQGEKESNKLKYTFFKNLKKDQLLKHVSLKSALDESEWPAPVALSPETEPGASNGQDYVSAKEPKLME
jgi:hypothetical protein